MLHMYPIRHGTQIFNNKIPAAFLAEEKLIFRRTYALTVAKMVVTVNGKASLTQELGKRLKARNIGTHAVCDLQYRARRAIRKPGNAMKLRFFIVGQEGKFALFHF